MDREQQENICEAVFRFMIAWGEGWPDGPVRRQPPYKAPPEQKRRWQVAFLSIVNKDPTDAFLRRFADIPVPVKKYSEHRSVIGDSGHGIQDPKTHLVGIIFYVEKVHGHSDAEAIVDCGYYAGVRNVVDSRFVVARGGGKWHVVRVHDLGQA